MNYGDDDNNKGINKFRCNMNDENSICVCLCEENKNGYAINKRKLGNYAMK